jgi:hypothetical protein
MKATRSFLALAAAVLCQASAQAAELLYTFDTGLQGWAAFDGGAPSWSAAGGNTGGFLQIVDETGGDLAAVFPSADLGNWSIYLGGSISFDGRNINGDSADWGSFGLITLTGSAGSLSLDLVALGQPDTDGQWHHYSVPLSVAAWGPNLPAVLASLTSATIGGEFHNGISETVGFDNIRVTTAVPEPTAAALWLAGLASLGFLARRRRD